ncbi:hypothetical protein [Marinobacter shengliensis]|uniref:hypothetical protein n=1 Tax=Marinobacter shengliensis TaxID=1389223 RepID=UPI0035B8EC8F
MSTDGNNRTAKGIDAEKFRRAAERVPKDMLYDRLIAAGFPLDKVNKIAAETSVEEIKEMHDAAMAMKECPHCPSLLSPFYLREAYFDFPVFHCQHCNGKIRVVVDEWHYGYELVEHNE